MAIELRCSTASYRNPSLSLGPQEVNRVRLFQRPTSRGPPYPGVSLL